MLGRIKSYNKAKGYGFIKSEDDKLIFFNIHAFKNKPERKDILKKPEVEFDVGEYNGNTCAVNIEIKKAEEMPGSEEEE